MVCGLWWIFYFARGKENVSFFFTFSLSFLRSRASKMNILLHPLTPSHVLRARVLRRRLEVGAVGLNAPGLRRHGDDLGRRRFACHPAVERGLLPPGREARGLFEPGDLVPHDFEPVVADNAPRVAGVLVPAPWRVWRGEGVDEVKRVGKLGEKR